MTHWHVQLHALFWLLRQKTVGFAGVEVDWAGSGRVDAVGVSHPAGKRIVVVEAKASRKDLMDDIRRQKMQQYERLASHCCLAVPKDMKEIALEVAPEGWGVIVCNGLRRNRAKRWEANVVSARPSARLRSPTPKETLSVLSSVASATTWRMYRMLCEEHGATL